MHNEIALSVAVLISLTIAGGSVAIAIARRLQRILSFRVLIIINYLIVYNASGLIHLVDPSRANRGYFDAVVQLRPGQLMETTLIAAVGLIAICAGALMGLPTTNQAAPVPNKGLSPRDRVMLPAVMTILLPISLWALFRIQAYASTLEVTRVISLSGGMARYFYISAWFAPAVFFTVIWLVSRLTRNQGLWTTLLVLTGALAVVAAFQWTGGRALTFVMCFPLIMVMAPRFKGRKGFAILATSALVLLFTANVLRQADSRMSSTRMGLTGVADWVDWEWGRFSLLGFAVDRVESHGLLHGETIMSTASRSFGAILNLFGIHSDTAARASMHVASEGLLNSTSAIHIVPGLSAELYLNFGATGVALGYFILGRLCGWIDERFDAASSLLTQLLWSYIGAILAFKTINLDSATAITSILYMGAPFIIVAGISYLNHRHEQNGGFPTDRSQISRRDVGKRQAIPNPATHSTTAQ